MLQYIERTAKELGAQNCQNCGKLDITFGLIKEKDGTKSQCLFCDNQVNEYTAEKSLLFALKLFRELAIMNNEVKASSGEIVTKTINSLLNSLLTSNKIPSDKELNLFQEFFKKPEEINFGGMKLGGFVKLQKGIPTVTIIEKSALNKVYSLFILSAVIKYLLTFKNNKSKATSATLSVMLGIMLSELFLGKENGNALNTFEVLLFSSIPILYEMKRKRPDIYSQFENEYFDEIEEYANKYGITKFVNGNLNNFIDMRFQLYHNEINGVLNDALMLPTKTAYNFFIEPLQNGNSDCLDMLKVTELKTRIIESFKSDIFGKSIDRMISDLNL